MKKEEYLAHVEGFVDWLAGHLKTGSTLGHRYRRPGQAGEVHFANLADAMNKYAWPIAAAVRGSESADDSLAANTLVLARLQAALKNARTDDDARDACIAVMQWGGVVNGNVDWLRNNTVGLRPLLDDVSALLKTNDDDIALLPANLRFNAGMTKVYSLLLDDFIIYDSRVAAALSWFVARWACDNKATSIPPYLRFPCMPAKEGIDPEIRKVRNPSTADWQFPRLNNRPRLHAQWNLRASWLLEAALEKAGADTVFGRSNQPLRMLEAALFMWGYDLGHNLPGSAAGNDSAVSTQDNEENMLADGDADLPARSADGYELSTLGRNVTFTWYFDEERDLVVTGIGNAAHNQISTTQMFCFLHALYYKFGSDGIPLANNRDFQNQIESAPAGMGTTLWQAVNKPLPFASRLGAILVALGQLRWNNQPRNITFQFAAPPPATIATLRDQLSAYAR